MEYTLTFSLILLALVFHGANGGSEVKFLPGFEGPLPFYLETGYVGVGETEDVQLFYYFVKSDSNPGKDPLILWLTGGPGCSAISGLIFEIGPIRFKEVYDGSFPTLISHPYSWTEVASIIFLDLPVGTGFSYARTPESSYSTDIQASEQAYLFLRKWLDDHDEFISNPFYVGGDSSVGLTAPIIVQMISNGNGMGIKPWINLKGYILGNPITFSDEPNYRIPFAYGMGLIPDELYELTDDVNIWHILQPKCTSDSQKPLELSGERRYVEEEFPPRHCDSDFYELCNQWINDNAVQEALNVRKGTIKIWSRCSRSLSYNASVWNAIPYHANISLKGYRSLIYNGDHDMVVPFHSTRAWIRSLNYSIVDEWRQWIVKGQIAGYTRSYANNMTFATVKGGGHVAPMLYPMESAELFKRWISYQPL